jgi:hypothetical protein
VVRAEGARALRHDGSPKKWLKSPAGWALANVWYDKYPGVPTRGSPLETLFLFVSIQRKEAELLATRSLVRGQFAVLAKSPETAKSAYDAYQAYADAMFPFLEQAANTTTDDHSRLMEHVKYPMQIDIQAIRQEHAKEARAKGLKKFKLGEKRR